MLLWRNPSHIGMKKEYVNYELLYFIIICNIIAYIINAI